MSDLKSNSPENFKVSGDWTVQSVFLKERFSRLTDSDILLEPGKDLEMLDRVQQRLNKNREEAIRIIRSAEQERSAGPVDEKL